MLFHLQTSYLVQWVKIHRTGYKSEAILPTDFILGTKIIHVPMTLNNGQGQRSRSNFPKMARKSNHWPYLGCYLTYRLHTWYQGTTHQGTFNDPGQGQNFLKNG